MYGLEERHLEFIKKTLKKYVKTPEAKFYIFGSRAKGTHKEYSDIDIAVDSPDFSLNDKTKINSEIENSTFPYEVDIVDLNSINDDFKNIIKDDMILFM